MIVDSFVSGSDDRLLLPVRLGGLHEPLQLSVVGSHTSLGNGGK